MTDRRVTEDTAIVGSAVADGDLFDLVDVSDTTDAATGTNKKITTAELRKTTTGLYDATGHTLSLEADANALTISDSTVDFVSHGKLALPPGGFTFETHNMPTWFDPSQSTWNTKGWFAFDYHTAFLSQHWGFATVEGINTITGTARNQFNVFGASGQGDADNPVLALWEADRTRNLFAVLPEMPTESLLDARDNGVTAWRTDLGDAGNGEITWFTIREKGTHGGTPTPARIDFQAYSYDGFGATEMWMAGVDDPAFTDKLIHLYTSPDDFTAFRIRSTAGQGTNPIFYIYGAANALTFSVKGTGDIVTAGSIALSSKKITGLANGSASDDAAAFGQIPVFATNAVILGTAAAAGSASTVMKSDATIAAFDATVPTTQAFGDSAATGSVAFAARRDHKHAMPASEVSDTAYGSGWDGVTTVAPSKNAVYDKINSMSSGSMATDTFWDAAGDLAVGIGADTAAKLAIGSTTGQALVVEPAASGKHAYGWTRDIDNASFLISGAIAQSTIRGRQTSATGVQPSTATLYLWGISLLKGEVATSITFLTLNTALAVGSNQWFGLFDSSRVPLQLTGDDTSTAWAANSLKTLNLASPYTVTYSGLHYVGFMVKATTMPNLQSLGVEAVNSGPATFAPIINGTSTGGLTNPASCPNPAGALTPYASRPFFYIS